MKSNVMKEFIIPTLVLTVICLVAAGALALTYQYTAPIIAQAGNAEANKTRAELLPEADDFAPVEVSGVEGLVDIFAATNGSGFVVTTTAKGYGGDLNVMTGIKTDGTISAVKMMENSETQGIGSKTGDPEYTGQYAGKDSSLEGVEAVTGATISSGAFKKAVGIAFTAYGQAAGVEVSGAAGGAAATSKEGFFEGKTAAAATVAGADEAYTTPDGDTLLVVKTKGYGGDMEVLVGFDSSKKIVKVALGANSETEGLGSKTGEAEYTDQYVGKTSTDGINAISGATVSSTAFVEAVGKAISIMGEAK